MKKVLIIGIFLSVVVGGIIGIRQAFKTADNTGTTSPLSNSSESSIKGVETTELKPTGTSKLQTFTDPSGFSFSYPETVMVAQAKANPELDYAKLEISSATHPGSVSILATTSSLQSIASWKKGEKLTTLKLADLDARQYDTGSELITGAVDQGVLFTITTSYKTDKTFWQGVHSGIVASFAFAPPPSSGSNSVSVQGGEGDVIFEGEEVVE